MNSDVTINNPYQAEVVRRGKKPPQPLPKSEWITTFADMVTLLLTFLVLLISVTTLDPRTTPLDPDGATQDQQREEIISGGGVLLFSDRGLMAPVIELVENIDRLPDTAMFDQSEIKNAVFQLEATQISDYEQLRAALAEGVTIVKDSRGLVVQWDRSLLFDEGSAEISGVNLPLLDKLTIFLQNVSLPISVEGHTNPLSAVEGGYGPEAYALSFERAKTVMSYLSSKGINERRMRLVGRGGDSPRGSAADSAWENGRLEIVIYKPAQGNPFAR